MKKANNDHGERLLNIFLDDANFVGVGIDVTEEIKIAVGGWAVFLVLNRPLTITWYRSIERISIYPGEILESRDGLGAMIDGSHFCQIHLAWVDIRDSSTKASVGRNTILHEFAHSLDHLDRVVDGHPTLLLSESEKDRWTEVFTADYIHAKPEKERKELWDFFGLSAWREFNPNSASCVDVGELFAVSTEFFFECPSDLVKHAPEIYDCLTMLYKFKPLDDFPKKRFVKKLYEENGLSLFRPKWT